MRKTFYFILTLIILLGLIYLFTNKKDNNSIKSSENPTTTLPVSTSTTSINSLDTINWIATSSSGISFKYPKDLGTTYIGTTDWPPALNIYDKPFSCTGGGTSETMPAGQTKSEIVNGRTYCVTKESEGAAGSTYTQYAYAFSYESKTAIMTFTLRYPQCMNYDNPKQTECKNEEGNIDISNLIDNIVNTVQ